MSEIKDFSEKIIEGRRKAVIRIKKGEEKEK